MYRSVKSSVGDLFMPNHVMLEVLLVDIVGGEGTEECIGVEQGWLWSGLYGMATLWAAHSRKSTTI